MSFCLFQVFFRYYSNDLFLISYSTFLLVQPLPIPSRCAIVLDFLYYSYGLLQIYIVICLINLLLFPYFILNFQSYFFYIIIISALNRYSYLLPQFPFLSSIPVSYCVFQILVFYGLIMVCPK